MNLKEMKYQIALLGIGAFIFLAGSGLMLFKVYSWIFSDGSVPVNIVTATAPTASSGRTSIVDVLNGGISNPTVISDQDKGILDIAFDYDDYLWVRCSRKGMAQAGHRLLVRLFDKNGTCLKYFFTKPCVPERAQYHVCFNDFTMRNRKWMTIPEKSRFSASYDLPVNILTYVKSAEIGFESNWTFETSSITAMQQERDKWELENKDLKKAKSPTGMQFDTFEVKIPKKAGE